MDSADEFLDQEEDAPDPEVSALRSEVSRLQRQLRNQQGATAMVTSIIESIFEDAPAPRVPPLPEPKGHKREEIAVLHLSDWQVGSLTEDFNTEIARHRLEDVLLPKVAKTLAARPAEITELHLLVGGDIVDGSGMRADHAWQVDTTVYQQAMHNAPRMLANAVLFCMGLCPHVSVWSVRGNHGRSGPKKADPNPVSVNWDTVTSEAARLMLGDVIDGERLHFDVEVERFYKIIPTGKKRVLLIHGDQFRGSGGFAGIPYYGIARNMAKWAESISEPWDVLMLGHFHVPASGMYGQRTWYLNGTLQTGSEFALEVLASATRPAQRLLIFDPERGPIADHVIWVDE